MKKIIALPFLLVAFANAHAAKVMQDVQCLIDNTTTGKTSSITAKTTDHKPGSDDPNEIWLRAAIPGFPGYYLQVWSYPGPLTEQQEIDLRVKTTAQLGTYDQFAWSSGYGESNLGVTLPGGKKVSFEITCSGFQ